MKGSEKQTLINMLDDLIHHFSVNKGSLLARIYGIFTIESVFFEPVDVIIMKNTAYVNKLNEKMTFDLKGSTANRRVKFSDDSYFRQNKCMKDLNFLEINKFYHNALLQLSRNDH